MEQKSVRKIVIMAVAAAAALLAILLITLIYNLAGISSKKKNVRALQDNLADLNAVSRQLDSGIEYCSTDMFKERYAREYLNMLAPGEKLYVPDGD